MTNERFQMKHRHLDKVDLGLASYPVGEETRDPKLKNLKNLASKLLMRSIILTDIFYQRKKCTSESDEALRHIAGYF